MDRGAWWATVHGVAKSQTTEATYHTCTCVNMKEGFMQCYLDGVQHGCFHKVSHGQWLVEGKGPHQKLTRGQHSPRQFPSKVLSSCSLT